MAQNITLLGASYTDVPAVELPKTGGGTATFTDTTPTTASASDVSQGKYFFTASGVLTLGTNQGGSGSVTQDQDGFIVLPPDGSGGGGSSYTLLGTEEITVSTSSTSTITIDNSQMVLARESHTDKILYIQVRDKAGKRNGCFFGMDMYWKQPVGGSASNDYRQSEVFVTNASGVVQIISTSQYGVFPKSPPTFSSGSVTITMAARCYSSYFSEIDGTYVVNVYDLDYKGDTPFK